MIYLTPVDHDSKEHAILLYDLLEERTVQQSISHRAMPTFKQHVAFVETRPYREWFLIGINGSYVGATYLSKANEIGIFIFNKYHGMGYGREAVEEMISRHYHEDLLANINPDNEASKAFFAKLGFAKLQETHILRGRNA